MFGRKSNRHPPEPEIDPAAEATLQVIGQQLEYADRRLRRKIRSALYPAWSSGSFLEYVAAASPYGGVIPKRPQHTDEYLTLLNDALAALDRGFIGLAQKLYDRAESIY